ncbi:MAG: hypothetical protein HW390_878 [Candidatus Brocadiaceae bacterium]|nr:hypothetical protein [Candidatus Brocadiaceae bacterium]
MLLSKQLLLLNYIVKKFIISFFVENFILLIYIITSLTTVVYIKNRTLCQVIFLNTYINNGLVGALKFTLHISLYFTGNLI